MEGAPKVGVGDTAGAAVGTALLPGIGTAVGSILPIGSIFKSGSPRYEGGPLVSSIQQRLNALIAGDPTAIAQSRSDAVSGGAGWKDCALVLAPAVRPDLFGAPARALNSTDQQILATVGGARVVTSTGGLAVAPAGSVPKPGGSMATASLFGNMSLTTLLLVGGGAFLAAKAFGGRRRRSRR